MQSFQLYTRGDTFLYRMDPRVKVLTVVAVFVISVLFDSALFLAPVFVAIMAVAVSARVPLSKVALLLKSLSVLVIISMVMWPLLYRDGTVLFEVVGLGITDEGIAFGIGMSFRIANMVTASIVLFLTTSQADFVSGLRGLGLPYKGAFALNLAFRFLPTITGVGQTIVEAQRARGLDPSSGGIAKRLRNYGRILGPLMITALRLAQQTVLAVEARGFSIGRTRSSYRQLAFERADFIALGIIGACFTAAVVLRLQGLGNV